MAVNGLDANMTMTEQDELNKKRGAFRDNIKQDYTGRGVEVRPLPIATATFAPNAKMAPVLRQGDVEGVEASRRAQKAFDVRLAEIPATQARFAQNRLDARLPTHRAIQDELSRREGIRMAQAQLEEQKRVANQQNDTIRYKTGVDALVKVAEQALTPDATAGKFDLEAMKQEQLNKRAQYNAEKELAKVDRTTNSAEKLGFLDANVKAGTGMFKAQTDREIADLNNAREWAKIAVDAKNVNNNAANKLIENKREFNLLSAKINSAGTPEDKQNMAKLQAFMDSVGNKMISGFDVSAEASQIDDAINNIAASNNVDLSTIAKSPSDMTQLIKQMTGEAPVPMVSRIEKMDTSVGAGRSTSDTAMARLSGGIDLTRQLAKFINGEKLTPEDIQLVQLAKNKMETKPAPTTGAVALPAKAETPAAQPQMTAGVRVSPMPTAEDELLAASEAELKNPPKYQGEPMVRADGTPRGNGWFGELKMADGRSFAEMPVPMKLQDGTTMLIPLLSKNQPRENRDYLLEFARGTRLVDPAKDKEIRAIAERDAIERLREGKSPFAEASDLVAPAIQPAAETSSEIAGVKKVTGKLELD